MNLKDRVILVIGPAKAGKDTVSKMLSELLDKKYAGTSDILYNIYSICTNKSVNELKHIDKELLRSSLIELGNYLTDDHPIFLSEKLLAQGYTIINGIRRKAELDYLQFKVVNAFVIYVDRNTGISDNFNISKDRADIVVENNEDLASLYEKIKSLINE